MVQILSLALGASTLLLGALWWRERSLRLKAIAGTELLTQKREAMRRSLEHLAEGVVLLGLEGEVLYANPAAMHLLGTKDLPSTPGRLPLERYTHHRPLIDMVMKTPPANTMRRVFEIETEKDSQHLPMLEVTLAPAGAERRLMVLQELRAEEAVERKRKDFVANASHELKTPTAALVGLLGLIEVVPEEKRGDLLERAKHNAEGLSNMIDDLLALTRAESPEWIPDPQGLSLSAAVTEVTDALKERAEKKGLRLEVQLPAEPKDIYADAFAFRTVLHNLVLNAVVYTMEGQVLVEVKQLENGCTEIRVKDTGPGIDAEILPRIFERFFRGDVVHSRASGGTGLGLALVRHLLRRMGGRISVQSTPGVGTEFMVELPETPRQPLAGAN